PIHPARGSGGAPRSHRAGGLRRSRWGETPHAPRRRRGAPGGPGSNRGRGAAPDGGAGAYASPGAGAGAGRAGGARRRPPSALPGRRRGRHRAPARGGGRVPRRGGRTPLPARSAWHRVLVRGAGETVSPLWAIHADAWAEPADVPSLNHEASDLILQRLEDVRRAGTREDLALTSSSLLLLGPAGAGKTHLFTRLR